MKEQNLEQLFKDALGNLEADVNPNLWTNIEQGLQTPVPGNSVAGSSSGFKVAGILGKMSLKSMFFVSAVTVTIIGTIIYLATEKTSSFTEIAPFVSSIESTPVLPLEIKTAAPEINVLTEGKPINSTNQKVSAPTKNVNAISIEQKSTIQESGTSVKKEAIESSSIVQHVLASNTPAKSVSMNQKVSDPITSANYSDIIDTKPDKNAEVTGKDPAADATPQFDANIENYLVGVEANMPKLPTIFTPNNDNLNDVFKINAINLKSLEVIIFDKRGAMVYSWKSLHGEWDGKLSTGYDAPEGNYFYTLNGETLEGKICIEQRPLKLTRSLK